MSHSFTGAKGVALYQALAIKSALKLYAKTGIKANRAYTPSAMMRMATRITDKAFKPRDYQGAIDALQEWIDAQPHSSVSEFRTGGR